MPDLAVAGKAKLHIPCSESQKALDAWVNIRYGKVEIAPPQNLPKESPVTAWAVYVKEQTNRMDVIYNCSRGKF